MAKSLAELRADATSHAAERVLTICLAQHLISRVQILNDEKLALAVELGTSDSPEEKGKPRRAGDPRQSRMTEINSELEALYSEMREHEGRLRLRATARGKWQRWAAENPPRVTGRDDSGRPTLNFIDENSAYGFCNADALLASAQQYAVSWNDEPIGDEDWQYLVDNAAPGDVKDICRTIVDMHEGNGGRAPKASSISSSTTEMPETA